MKPIRLLGRNLDVSHAMEDLALQPGLWGERTQRLETYAHSGISDIWVRYNPQLDLGLADANNEHDSEWLPASEFLPGVKGICYDIMRFVEGDRLGGVLITKIPPGGKVLRLLAVHLKSACHSRPFTDETRVVTTSRATRRPARFSAIKCGRWKNGLTRERAKASTSW